MRRSACLTFVLMLGLFGRVNATHSASANETIQALDALSEWLGDRTNADRWHRYLKTDELRRELAKSESADPAVIKTILSAYSNDAPGLDRSQFLRVRLALREWYTQLTLPAVTELPEYVRGKKTNFDRDNTSSLDDARQRLVWAMEHLDQYLKQGGQAKALFW